MGILLWKFTISVPFLLMSIIITLMMPSAALVMSETTSLHTSDEILLASTLNGAMVAMNANTGTILWQLQDEPVIKSPYDRDKPSLPAVLPDPKDGSIYILDATSSRRSAEPLSKLPFTIPQLVSTSPCRSKDGVLYTGKKIDTWLSIDRSTGDRDGVLNFGGCLASGHSLFNENICPKSKASTFLIGRTEYNIMMFDSRHGDKGWNISFYDYSSNLIKNLNENTLNNYELAHFTDSSTGSLLTLEKVSGAVRWEQKMSSPIVAMFKLESSSIGASTDNLISIPFTSVSKKTLENLMNGDWSSDGLLVNTKLFPTLYIGEHSHGLYAMPSLVDEMTFTISIPSKNNRQENFLLEGPSNSKPENFLKQDDEDNRFLKDDAYELGQSVDSHSTSGQMDIFSYSFEDKSISSSPIFFGYYQVAESSTSSGLNYLQLTGSQTPTSRVVQMPPPVPPTSKKVSQGFQQIYRLNTSFIFSREIYGLTSQTFFLGFDTFAAIENKELKLITLLLAIAVFTMIMFFKKTLNVPSISGFRVISSTTSSNSSVSPCQYEVTAIPVELGDGLIKVGNIMFDQNAELGKGCEGTFVYKGRFDNRDVAVKRVLAACFSIVDREVHLLRESDMHPNVVRYFCMEADRQFRYIALELCCANLQDFVEGHIELLGFELNSITILRQTTQGLSHLHSLDIAHRDIKPHNVLISMPDQSGVSRAMISDFGLCKKLKLGRMSFSRRSGIAGTEGWIAPEMMLGNHSTTCSVDIFSLGCVFSYVLSGGRHPFGESYRRQANILAGDFDLTSLVSDNRFTVAKDLIEKMLSPEPLFRPNAKAILRHPIFWSKEKTLNFFQDISDRLELESPDSCILKCLEMRRWDVVRNNWHLVLDQMVAEDLLSHRGYRCRSVRDLLRALRNKKHHYNQLPEAIRQIYGKLPDGFSDYWTSRFPNLLIHCWYAMHRVKNEDTFLKYFDKDFDFVKTDRFHSAAIQTTEKCYPEDLSQFQSKFFNQDTNQRDGLMYKDVEDEDFGSPTHLMPCTNGKPHNGSVSSVISEWDNISVSSQLYKTIPKELISSLNSKLTSVEKKTSITEVEQHIGLLEFPPKLPSDKWYNIPLRGSGYDTDECLPNCILSSSTHKKTRGRKKGNSNRSKKQKAKLTAVSVST